MILTSVRSNEKCKKKSPIIWIKSGLRFKKEFFFPMHDDEVTATADGCKVKTIAYVPLNLMS